MQKKVVVVITGTIASGKGFAAEFFRKQGFEHHSFSNIIREIAKERKIPIDRKHLHALGLKLRKESKTSILAQRVAQHLEGKRAHYVVEGIRDLGELSFLKKKFNCVLIGVDADPHIRFERLKKRGRKGDSKTFLEFLKIDNSERKGSGEVDRILKKADYLISNEGSEQAFKKELKKALSHIKSNIK